MTADRRSQQRIKKSGMVHFSVPEKILDGYGILRDLCGGGMQISLNTELKIGEVMELFDTDSLPCSSGIVRWCRSAGRSYLIGIEFSEPIKMNVSSSIFQEIIVLQASAA